MKDSLIENNLAFQIAGGVFLDHSKDITLDNIKIFNNEALS